jgi:hypothetical protein
MKTRKPMSMQMSEHGMSTVKAAAVLSGRIIIIARGIESLGVLL